MHYNIGRERIRKDRYFWRLSPDMVSPLFSGFVSIFPNKLRKPYGFFITSGRIVKLFCFCLCLIFFSFLRSRFISYHEKTWKRSENASIFSYMTIQEVNTLTFRSKTICRFLSLIVSTSSLEWEVNAFWQYCGRGVWRFFWKVAWWVR